jgi:hypothetical protein
MGDEGGQGSIHSQTWQDALVLPEVLQSHLTPQHHREDGRKGSDRFPVPDGITERLVAQGPMRISSKRSTINALAFLKQHITSNYRIG